jgi:hypothetical protein
MNQKIKLLLANVVMALPALITVVYSASDKVLRLYFVIFGRG